MITEEMLEEARTLAIQLKEIKAREMELRKVIVSELTAGFDIGTHNLDHLYPGFNIKAKLGVSYSIDQDELKYLLDENMLTDTELDCIRTKYDLRLKDYKSCEGDTETLDDVIIVKPSAPTLEITLGE